MATRYKIPLIPPDSTLTIAATKTLLASANTTISGADISIVGSGTATITYPVFTSTLATLALVETLSNKTLTAPIVSILKPVSDSTTAIRLTKADGTTAVLTVDTTNSRFGIGITPTAVLHLKAGTATAGTAPLKFTTQASGLSTADQGAMELIGNSLQFTQLAKRRGVSMTQAVRTSTTTIENSVSESSALITAEHGANYLEVGKLEEIILMGTIEQRSNASANITFRVKYAGTTIQTLVGPSTTDIAANTPFVVMVRTTCRSIGASGSMQINAILNIAGNIADNGASSLATIDTTTAQNTTITAQWGEANASDILKVEQGRVLCIEPNK